MSAEALGVPRPRPASDPFFVTQPDAAYWAGIVADGGVVTHPDLYAAAKRLRAVVYVEEMGFLDAEHVDSAGQEADAFDEQSFHIVVVQAATETRPVRVVGTMRVIVKADAASQLPIEQDFADAFAAPAVAPSAEISRFIARHEDQGTQHLVAVSLIRAATYQILGRGIDTAYFEIERPLLQLLRLIGIPMEQIGEPHLVQEPGGLRTLYPLRVPVAELPSAVTNDGSGRFSLRDFFQSQEDAGGLGFFDALLMGIPAHD